MFRKLVAIGPVHYNETFRRSVGRYAAEVIYHPDVPRDEAELIAVIGDADALLVALQVTVPRAVIEACPQLRYIGMCCSLYSAASANVDIEAAAERGIPVLGLRDYGDEGVIEYALAALVDLLHGFYGPRWREQPLELTALPVGILGMGTLGSRIGRALRFMGADVHYFSRTRKPEIEAEGMPYHPFEQLIDRSDVLISCVHKNTLLMTEEALRRFGAGKILMNVSIGPCAEPAHLARWLDLPGTYFLCDHERALGDPALLARPNVLCPNLPAGATAQLDIRRCEKLLENLEKALAGSPRWQSPAVTTNVG